MHFDSRITPAKGGGFGTSTQRLLPNCILARVWSKYMKLFIFYFRTSTPHLLPGRILARVSEFEADDFLHKSYRKFKKILLQSFFGS